MNEEPERGSKMNGKIFAVNLVVPLLAVIIIAAIAGWFRRGKKESIKDELFEYFVKVWNVNEKEPDNGEEGSFFQRFFKMFVKAYDYEKYKEEEKVFLNVKPGITGYNQAYYRNSADAQEKIDNDVYYAKNISFALDVKIFFKTIKTVVCRDNVNVTRD